MAKSLIPFIAATPLFVLAPQTAQSTSLDLAALEALSGTVSVGGAGIKCVGPIELMALCAAAGVVLHEIAIGEDRFGPSGEILRALAPLGLAATGLGENLVQSGRQLLGSFTEAAENIGDALERIPFPSINIGFQYNPQELVIEDLQDVLNLDAYPTENIEFQYSLQELRELEI